MWTATITDKKLSKGRLTVTVTYTKDENSFSEPYQIFNLNELNSKVKNKLDEMARLEVTESQITLGVFTPNTEPDSVDEKDIAYQNVVKAKGDFDLGLITKAEYEAIVTAYKLKK